jgi:hypothetical protein
MSNFFLSGAGSTRSRIEKLVSYPRNTRYFVWRPPDQLALFQGASEAPISYLFAGVIFPVWAGAISWVAEPQLSATTRTTTKDEDDLENQAYLLFTGGCRKRLSARRSASPASWANRSAVLSEAVAKKLTGLSISFRPVRRIFAGLNAPLKTNPYQTHEY